MSKAVFNLMTFLSGLLKFEAPQRQAYSSSPPPSNFSRPPLGPPSLFDLILGVLYLMIFIFPLILVFVALVAGIVYFLQSRGELPESPFKDRLLWVLKQYKLLFMKIAPKVWHFLLNFNPIGFLFKKKIFLTDDEILIRTQKVGGAKKDKPNLRQAIFVTDIYLSFVELSSRLGFFRHRSDTPFGYSKRVLEKIPQNSSEVNILTDSFVKRRYGDVVLSDEQVKLVRKNWKILKGNI